MLCSDIIKTKWSKLQFLKFFEFLIVADDFLSLRTQFNNGNLPLLRYLF